MNNYNHLWKSYGPITTLFMIDVILSFLYAAVPTNYTAIRSLVDVVQFIAMSGTMFIALGWAIESL